MIFPRIRARSAFLGIKTVNLLPILTYISIVTSSLTPTCFLQFTYKTMQVFLVSAMRPPPYNFEIQQEASLIFLISILNRFLRKILQCVSFISVPSTNTVTACPCPSRPHFYHLLLQCRCTHMHVHQRHPSLKYN